jgi:hypothetical protein
MKDAYYFSHDTNAKSDPKIMAMRNIYKSEGYGWYWIIVETLAEQSGYKLQKKEWVFNALAMAMQCDINTTKSFIKQCIDEFELFETNGECFWSNSLIRRMEKKDEKRRKRVEAGRKGAESRWRDNKKIAKLKQTHSNAIAKDGKVKESKVKESKGKESKGKDKDARAKSQPKKTKYAEFVSLTNAEHTALVAKLGDDGTKRCIEILDNYKGSTGKRYRSDYRTILNWVVQRYEDEQKQKSNKPSGNIFMEEDV